MRCLFGHDWLPLFTREFVEANYPLLEIAEKCKRCRKVRIELHDTAEGGPIGQKPNWFNWLGYAVDRYGPF